MCGRVVLPHAARNITVPRLLSTSVHSSTRSIKQKKNDGSSKQEEHTDEQAERGGGGENKSKKNPSKRLQNLGCCCAGII